MAANRDLIKDSIIDAMLTNMGNAAVSDEQLAAIERTAEAIAYPVADEIDANSGTAAAGINWRGAYDPGALYLLNDAVFHPATRSAYVCALPATGIAPTDTTYWSILAQGGTDGVDGIGISSSSYNDATGILTLTFTNGATFSTGDLRGANGVGISGSSYNAGTGILTITYTNGATFSTGDLRGATGNGIASSSYNPATGVLTLTYTNGATFSTGDLRGTSGIAMATYTASNAAFLDIPIPSGYARHEIELLDINAQTANAEIWARVLTGAGSVQSGASDYTHVRFVGGTGSALTQTTVASDSKIVLIGGLPPSGANRAMNFLVDIFNPSGTTNHKQLYHKLSGKTNAGNLLGGFGFASFNQAAAITHLRALCSTGNLTLTAVIRSYP